MELQSSCIVLKFGGASLSSPEAFSFVADIILHRRTLYKKVVIVVSAMGNTTDELISLAHKVHPNPPSRELDMLISTGERTSIALLAMALLHKKCEALSFTGSQSGILTTNDHTNAKIVSIKPQRLLPQLEAGKVVIVAGFQGMSLNGEITTLGRGGSDTTAVALAVALNAKQVEFFKDVDGMFDKDPKKYSNAKIFSTLTYEEALEIVRNGSKILHDRCIKLAQKNSIPLRVLSFHKYLDDSTGTLIENKVTHEKNKTLLFEE